MPPPRSPFDALRYGLRALEEMSRAEASVVAPARTDDLVFAPHPLVRPTQRDGAALSLRLFSDGVDDATAFVLRDADSLSLSPIPARAGAFFEAHLAALARGDDDELVVGFPLVSFVQTAQRRTAPLLFWSGARATWRIDDADWQLPHGVRLGTAVPIPTSLVLRAPEPEDDEPSFGLHAGLWRQLLDVDGPALAALSRAGRGGVGALVRAAVLTLTRGVEETPEEDLDDAPPTRDELRALVDAVRARASARLSLQAHPHALAMLLPKGDPTSGLRSELASILGEPTPKSGPLAVFLGAKPAPSKKAPLWTHGASTPTRSQVEAAIALEGSLDLVALCGPPGCGKTTLLHHLAAQTIVSRALDDTWVKPPAPSTPWGLVVTSTNNAAVDHALAPFVASRALPVGLRLGNRRALAELAAPALRAALEALSSDDGPALPAARAAFEERARPAREHLRAMAALGPAKERRKKEAARLRERRDELRPLLAPPLMEVDDEVLPARVNDARGSLGAHARASMLLVEQLTGGGDRSPSRAMKKWRQANVQRGKVIRPVLAKLGLEVPFAELVEGEDMVAALTRQHDAMELSLAPRRGRALAARPRPSKGARPGGVRAHCRRGGRRGGARCAAARPLAGGGGAGGARRVGEGASQGARPPAGAGAGPRRGRALRRAREGAGGGAGLGVGALPCGGVHAALAARVLRARPWGDRPAGGRRGGAVRAGVHGGRARPCEAGAGDRRRGAAPTGVHARRPPRCAPREGARRGRDGALPHGGLGHDLGAGGGRGEGVGAAVAHRALPVAARDRDAGLGVERLLARCANAVALSGAGVASAHPAGGGARRGGRGGARPGGIVNEAEAARVVALVEALVVDGVAARDVAVLTPFVGQSARIERELVRRGLVHDDGVLVRTVHKLQGGERRVVVFSVTATEPKHLRWLASRPHLLHVAASRAQDHLVVYLDAQRARGEALLRPLVELAR
nr:ATP-binding domain-containing protein [Deltaproteobacteria bacterium]